MSRLGRALVALATLAVLYGIASEIGSRFLPRRIWLTVHYVEGVELIPTYRSLAEETVFLLQAGLLQGGVVVSAGRVLGGMLLGALVGLPLGVATARARSLEHVADPWVAFFRFTPALALLPLYVLWFGSGEIAKILLVASGVAIITLHGAFAGVRGVPSVYLDAATSLGAGRRQTLGRIILPAALPQVVASLRIATALAWVTIVVAELIDPTMPSLGYLLALSGAYPRVPTMVIAIATIGVVVLVSDSVLVAAYHRSTRWMRRRDA